MFLCCIEQPKLFLTCKWRMPLLFFKNHLTQRSKVRVWSCLAQGHLSRFWRGLNPSIPPVLSPLEPSSEAEFILQTAGHSHGPQPLVGAPALQDESWWAPLSFRSISGIQTGNRPTSQPGSLSGLQPTAAYSLLLTCIDGTDGADHHLREISFFCFPCCVAWFLLPRRFKHPRYGGLSSRDCSTWRDFQMSRRRRNNLYLTK